MRPPPRTLVLLGIVALPVGTLMLAKLFDSAVLGWMFGLMLMFGAALLPLAVIVYAAYRLIRWMVGRSRADVPAAQARQSARTIQVERASVHASDDASSWQITVPATCTLREVVAEALAHGDLLRISGGRATWVVKSSGGQGPGFRPIAVWSQECMELAFVVDPEQSAANHFGNALAGLRFDYRDQDDPDSVFNELTLPL